MELLFMLLVWILPIALVVFLVTSLQQIIRALGAIENELASIRRLLERNSIT